MDEGLRERLRQQNFRSANSAPQSRSARPVRPAPIRVEQKTTPAVRPERVKRHFPKISKVMVIALLTILVLSVAAFGTFSRLHAQKSKASASVAKLNGPPALIPIYYPQNLPSGYTYNKNAKLLKPDILFFTVSGPDQSIFYITQQAIPAKFDFKTFNKKFLTPDVFSAPVGTVTAGAVGPSNIGSIQTNKNTWILINTSPKSTLTGLETVARSFELEEN